MTHPTLTIETSTQGINRFIIHVKGKDSARGFAFLHKILPILEELDQRSRDLEHLVYEDGKQG